MTKNKCDATDLEARVKGLENRVKHLEAQKGSAQNIPLTKDQLKQIAQYILPIIENEIFGQPEIDLEKDRYMTPAQRTRFAARLLADMKQKENKFKG